METKINLAVVAVMLVGRMAVAQDVDVRITVGPPLSGAVFEQPPPVVLVPQTGVYYAPSVSEYDTYRMRDWWYINREGYWYRSRDPRGSFEPLRYDGIPREILALPEEYHHHPRYREQRARERAYDKGYDDALDGEHRHPRAADPGRARAYDEGAYDASHEGPGEKHEGKHYGKHKDKHTQHD